LFCLSAWWDGALGRWVHDSTADYEAVLSEEANLRRFGAAPEIATALAQARSEEFEVVYQPYDWVLDQ